VLKNYQLDKIECWLFWQVVGWLVWLEVMLVGLLVEPVV